MDDPLSVYLSQQLIRDYFEKLKFHNARKIVCVCVLNFTSLQMQNLHFCIWHQLLLPESTQKIFMPCFLVFLKQTQNLFTLHSLKSLFVVNFPESEMNVILT